MHKVLKKPTVYHGTDEVLQAIWRIKDALSAARGHSVEELFAAAHARQKHSGQPIANFSKGKSSRGKTVAA